MKHAIIASAVAILLLTGCAGFREVEPIASKVRVVAYIGTYEILQERPEWRGGFSLAAEDLRLIEQSGKIDSATILAVVHRLPVNELRSPRAALYFTAGAMLLDDVMVTVDLTEMKDLWAIVTALREGIELGLAQ